MGTDDAGSERRLHKRVKVEIMVKLRFSSVDQLLLAHSLDLSTGGMFLKGLQASSAGVPRKVGQHMQVQFEAEGERIVEGEARIVRVTDSGVGIEFVSLDEMSAQLIEAIVRRQLGHSEP